MRELLATHSDPDVFRYFCLQHRYSSDLHYSPERMVEAAAVQRIMATCAMVAAVGGTLTLVGIRGSAPCCARCHAAEQTHTSLML